MEIDSIPSGETLPGAAEHGVGQERYSIMKNQSVFAPSPVILPGCLV